MFARLSTASFARKAATGVAALGVTTFSYRLVTHKDRKERIVIVGGGTAGVGVASLLKHEGVKNITVIEPSDTHYYQPLWSLVGGGVKPVEASAKPMKDVMPRGTNWIQKRVSTFKPETNQVTMEDGTKVDYDYLVVAAGLQIDWNKIEGLEEALRKEDSGVVSIYDYRFADKTYKTFESLKEKMQAASSPVNMVFTMSPTGIKCAGAPQKIMYLLEDKLRSFQLRDKAKITFWTPGGAMFGVKHYSEKLNELRKEKDIAAVFKQVLIKVHADKKLATFKNVDTNEITEETYDMLHVAPLMSAPDFIKGSPISDQKGFVDVNKHTLQSKKFDNVFALGDCANTPNSKTAAAITSQAPVLVHNMMQVMDGQIADGIYAGYASCPLIISQKSVMLAEFGYGGKLMETFGKDTGKFPLNMIGTEGAMQRRFFYFLKEQLFPFVYWNLWTKGMWYGTNGPIKPRIDRNAEKASNQDPALAK